MTGEKEEITSLGTIRLTDEEFKLITNTIDFRVKHLARFLEREHLTAREREDAKEARTKLTAFNWKLREFRRKALE